MTLAQWASFAVLLGVTCSAPAQHTSAHQQSANLDSALPAISYTSAFAAYQPFHDPETSPSTVWRAANNAVLGQGGHGAHMAPATPAEPGQAAQPPAAQAPATPDQKKKGGHSAHH